MLLAGPEAQQLALRHNRSLTAALTGTTAAVVGVIANLTAYFAVHTLFSATRTVDAGPIQRDGPDLASLQVEAVAVMALACWLILGRAGLSSKPSVRARPWGWSSQSLEPDPKQEA
jgi:chromate transporter